MHDQDPPLSFEAVCRYAGQLFLESQHEIARLRQSLKKAEAERDQLLAALRPHQAEKE